MKRNISIDLLKGLAIIAVVLYHLGVSPSGYLGVDVFFVISGSLAAVGLIRSFENNRFSYWDFLNKRLARLWPGLVLISAVSLCLGWMVMLPLHYKLECESVVGTLTFTNNIVQYITGGDYWASTNELKPLMHTWYIGILMQFYLVIPVIFFIGKRFTKNWISSTFYILTGMSVLSLSLYISPLMSDAQNFYLLPSRFYEIASGCLLALAVHGQKNNLKKLSAGLFCTLLGLSLLFVFIDSIPAVRIRLITVTAMSLLMVGGSVYFTVSQKIQRIVSPITFLGVASYSLYLSHQVFFAYYRYIVNSVFTTATYLGVLIATIVVGVLLYFLFEKPLSTYLSKKRTNMYKVNGFSVILIIILSSISLYYYHRDGMVRNVPELNLYVGKNNQTPEEYNQAPFQLNKDFENNGRKNILVLGDSFGRDWVNILHEAGVDSVMNISYQMYVDNNTEKRIEKADYIFVSTNLPFFESYNYDEIYPVLFNRHFYRVGLKSFGIRAMGNIYNQRFSDQIYSTTVTENKYSSDINKLEKSFFKDNFIDMMTPVMEKDGTVRLFTDDNMLITQDAIHLTKAGAKMYADKLNVWQYLK